MTSWTSGDYGKDIRSIFRRQAALCREMESPFVGRLCDLAADRLVPGGAVADALLGWPADGSAWPAAVPARFAGALHALVLRGQSDALARVFPPNHEDVDDDTLWSAMDVAIRREAEHVLAYLASPPQTNEVRRSAVIAAGLHEVCRRTGLPVQLTEIGASAGLNLWLDRYRIVMGQSAWGDPSSPVVVRPLWRGASPQMANLLIRERAACDVAPLDPRSESDCLRLLSYVWADQVDRLERLRAALAIASRGEASVVKASLLEWLPTRLARQAEGVVHVVYHTIVWPYLTKPERGRLQTTMEDAGARATADSPLAWLRFEPDGVEPGGAVTRTLWPGGETVQLGRADYHGRWVDWAAT